MSNRIQFRRDTKARWAEINPVLMEGEVGLEVDTQNIKMGDGTHAWNDLEYGVGYSNVTSEPGNNENLVISQKGVTELVKGVKEGMTASEYPTIRIEDFAVGVTETGSDRSAKILKKFNDWLDGIDFSVNGKCIGHCIVKLDGRNGDVYNYVFSHASKQGVQVLMGSYDIKSDGTIESFNGYNVLYRICNGESLDEWVNYNENSKSVALDLTKSTLGGIDVNVNDEYPITTDLMFLQETFLYDCEVTKIIIPNKYTGSARVAIGEWNGKINLDGAITKIAEEDIYFTNGIADVKIGVKEGQILGCNKIGYSNKLIKNKTSKALFSLKANTSYMGVMRVIYQPIYISEIPKVKSGSDFAVKVLGPSLELRQKSNDNDNTYFYAKFNVESLTKNSDVNVKVKFKYIFDPLQNNNNLSAMYWNFHENSFNNMNWQRFSDKNIINDGNYYDGNAITKTVNQGVSYVYIGLHIGGLTVESAKIILNHIYLLDDNNNVVPYEQLEKIDESEYLELEGEVFMNRFRNINGMTENDEHLLSQLSNILKIIKYTSYDERVKNVLTNKKSGHIGDSLTADNTYGQYGGNWPGILKNVYGMAECDNKSVGGSRIIGTIPDQIAELTVNDPNFLTIFGGQNDKATILSNTSLLGELSDNPSKDGTFFGNYQWCIEELIKKYPNAKIYCITPWGPSDTATIKIVDAIIKCANKYKCEVIDLYNDAVFDFCNAGMRSIFQRDDVHLSKETVPLFANYIAKMVSGLK